MTQAFPFVLLDARESLGVVDCGIYGRVEFSQATWQIAASPDAGSSDKTSIQADSYSNVLGLGLRIWPDFFGTNRVWGVAYAGFSLRALGGGVTSDSDLRMAALGTRDILWLGPEIGFSLRIGEAEIGMRVPVLFGGDGDVEGLTKGKVLLTATVYGGLELLGYSTRPGKPRGGIGP